MKYENTHLYFLPTAYFLNNFIQYLFYNNVDQLICHDTSSFALLTTLSTVNPKNFMRSAMGPDSP